MAKKQITQTAVEPVPKGKKVITKKLSYGKTPSCPASLKTLRTP